MTAVGTKLAFDNGGAFIQDTRREVEQYLSRGRTRVKGAVLLYSKAPIALALTVCSWVASDVPPPGIVVALALPPRARARSDADRVLRPARRESRRLLQTAPLQPSGRLVVGLLLGFSSYAWRVKHNVAHHTYTNVDGYDADVTQVPLARFTPSQTARPWYRFQQYYIWPMYMLMGLRWQTLGDIAALRRGGASARARCASHAAGTSSGILAGKAFFISWAIVIPLLVYPWWVVARRLRRLRDGHEPDHGDDVPARPLRRGGIVRVGRRARAKSAASGPCTRSRRPSTSARAIRC